MTTTLRQVLIFAALILAVAFAYRIVTFQPVMRQLVGLPPIPASVQFPDKR